MLGLVLHLATCSGSEAGGEEARLGSSSRSRANSTSGEIFRGGPRPLPRRPPLHASILPAHQQQSSPWSRQWYADNLRPRQTPFASAPRHPHRSASSMRQRDQDSFSIRLSSVLLVHITLARSVAARTSPFVLVDLPGRQLYPLFGIFPYPAPIPHQVLYATGLLLSVLVFSLLRHIVSDLLFELAQMISSAGFVPSPLASRHGLAAPFSPHATSSSSNSLPKNRLRRKAADGASLIHPVVQGKAEGSHYAGLVNTGNTCFFNSVIQSLASVSPFTEHLANLRQSAEQLDVPTPIVDALLELITALNSPAVRRSAIRPSALTDALSIATQSSSIRSLMTAHQQQDAHELLVLLLESLSRERTAVLTEEHLVENEAQGSGLASILAKSIKPASRYFSKARRKHCNPFEALVAQRTACLRCGYYDVVRNFVQEEVSVNVPLQRRGGGGLGVEDCLDSWAGLEGVEWRCWRCTLVFNLNKAEAESYRLSSAGNAAERKGRFAVDAGAEVGSEKVAKGGSASTKTKITPSVKKRLKEVRKTHSALTEALSKSGTEEEFRALHPSIRLLAPPLPPPSSSGSVITATKQTVFSRPPQTLVIHLNRSIYHGMGAGKNNTQVHLQEYLNLARWCITSGVESDAIKGMNETSEEAVNGDVKEEKWAQVGANGKVSIGQAKKPIWMNHHVDDDEYSRTQTGVQPEERTASLQTLYKLDSIVVHYGGHSFGHYVSFRRRLRRKLEPDEQEKQDSVFSEAGETEGWLRISDDSVTPVSLRDALGQNAFLLLYHRVESGSETCRGSYAAVPRAVLSTSNGLTDGVMTPSLAVAHALNHSRIPKARSLQRWELTARCSVEPASNGEADDETGATTLPADN